MKQFVYGPQYPPNWYKASVTLRRSVGRCERCGTRWKLTVHHRGARYAAGGRRGHPSDKHDLRRENLQVLCKKCHRRREIKWLRKCYYVHQAYLAKKALHDVLGVGTGLVLVCEVSYAR